MFKMDFIKILLVLVQIVLSSSEKCSNISKNCVVDEIDLKYGFYETPQISHYEEGEF